MRFLKPYILLFVLPLLCIAASAQYNRAFDAPYPQRFPLLDSLFKQRIGHRDSVSIAREIDLLYQTAKEKSDKKAMLLADFYRFAWFYYSPWMTEQQALSMVNADLLRADELDFPELKAFITLHLGHYYFTALHKTGAGLYNLLQAHDLYMQLPDEAFPWKGSCLTSLAEIFYRFGDYEKAIRFGRSAENYLLDKFQALRNLDVIGMAYLKSAGYDSALFYFDKSLQLLKNKDTTHIPEGWDGILTGNKGYVYYRTGHFDKAIPLFEEGTAITEKANLWDNTCGFATGLANIYLQQNKLNEAAALLPFARSATYRGGNEEDYFDLYKLLSAYNKTAGNYQDALRYTDSATAYKDSLTKRLNYRVQAQAELAFEIEKRKAGEKLLKAEVRNQRLFKWGAMVFVLLIVIIALLFYNRQTFKMKVQRQQAAQELLMSETRLQEFAAAITEKNRLIEHLEQQAGSSLSSEEMLKLQQTTILTDEEWNRFREMFEKVHGGYLQRLKQKLPGLSPAETRFMALAKLGLSNKEMAVSLGIGTNAIRITWHRLRKKLNLPEEGSLQELVEQV